MGFLTKKAILQAYKCLSHLSEDPLVQGATQKVSAIRYFLALDRFYKQYHRDCNTKDTSDKKVYAGFVGDVCSVCLNLYTCNFYYPLKNHNGDFCVGSNFYSAGQVKASRVNPALTVDYPQRGNMPLFRISSETLIRDTSLYTNLGHYIENDKLKAAFVIWLLRETDIVRNNAQSFCDNLYEAISQLYTDTLIDTIYQNDVDVNGFLSAYDNSLSPSPCSIEDKDIKDLFTAIPKDKFDLTKINVSKEIKYLTALRTKPFMLLAGVSGTGKSRIVRKLAQATVTEALQRKYGSYDGADFTEDRWSLHSPANFQLIQVKPNWHNSMDVVGYLSNIPAPHYVFTPFVNFIAKAWMNPDVPFFLCLDEMNLAPVEEYFAEFLSAIESRSFENGEYMTDPIVKPFNEFGDGIGISMIKELNDAMGIPVSKEVEEHLRTKGLTLPKNLIVTGTVNMDETTFSFSRKVLDRAMSIEMNEVDYGSFLTSCTDDGLCAVVSSFERGGHKRADGAVLTLNGLLVDRHIEAREVIGELGGTGSGSDARFVIDYLETVNRLLEGTPFKLGYRAANEALIYVRSAMEFGIGDRASAMDEFTLMKVLSRIEGDEQKLKITDSDTDLRRLERCGVTADEASEYGELTILTAMRAIVKDKLGECAEPEGTAEPDEGTEAEDLSKEAGRQRKSIQKIDQMISQLARDHFVSYWS